MKRIANESAFIMYYRSTSKKSYGDVPVHGPFGRIFSREIYI